LLSVTMRRLILAAAAFGALAAAKPLPVSPQPFESPQPSQAARPFDAAREKRLEWFRDAKYGLFIHWGLYAIPAGEWQGKRHLGLGAWIMFRTPVPGRAHEKLAAQVHPGKDNAAGGGELAKDSGLKYIVIPPEHQHGF